MSEIGNSFIFPKPTTRQEQDFYQTTQDFVTQVIKILNRGIVFKDNVNCRTISYTSNGSANTEDGITHTLGKVPTGYIVVSQNKAGVVYNGSSTWTTTTIYLKNSVATVAVTIIIF